MLKNQGGLKGLKTAILDMCVSARYFPARCPCTSLYAIHNNNITVSV